MSDFVQLGEHDNAYDFVLVVDRLSGRSSSEQQISQQNNEELRQQAMKEGLNALVTSGSFVKLLETGFLSSLPDFLSSASEDDLSTLFHLYSSLIPRIPRAEAEKITSQVLKHLTSSQFPSLSPKFRLELLIDQLNLINFTFRCSSLSGSSAPTAATVEFVANLMIAIIQYVLDNKMSGMIAHLLGSLESQVSVWSSSFSLAAPLVVELSGLLYSAASAANLAPNQVEEFLYRYLTRIDSLPSPHPLLVASRSAAQFAAIRSIAAPIQIAAQNLGTAFTPARLLTLKAINELGAAGASAEDKAAFDLLKIFACDSISDYLSFYSANAKFLTQHNLNHEVNLRKLRTLSLCSLAAQHENSNSATILSYDLIAQHLKLDSNESVELSVIDAIKSGRIDAKMDEESATVIVKRVYASVIKVSKTAPAQADWAGLSKKLRTWRGAIQSVLNSFHPHQLPTGPGHQNNQEEVAEEI